MSWRTIAGASGYGLGFPPDGRQRSRFGFILTGALARCLSMTQETKKLSHFALERLFYMTAYLADPLTWLGLIVVVGMLGSYLRTRISRGRS